MDAGIANYTASCGVSQLTPQRASHWDDAGAQVFDDQMPDMDEPVRRLFRAIANGAPPAEAALRQCHGSGRARFWHPTRNDRGRFDAENEAFNQALAGDTPEGAFEQLEVGGEAARSDGAGWF